MTSIVKRVQPPYELPKYFLLFVSMQLNTNTQPETSSLSFQGLLLEELLLEPNLRQEFNVPEKLANLAQRFSKKAASILHGLIVSKTYLPIPSEVIKEVVDFLFTQRHTNLVFRSISDGIGTVRSPQDKYNSCCRSAICHAVVGSYDFAFGALRIAASVNDCWATSSYLWLDSRN